MNYSVSAGIKFAGFEILTTVAMKNSIFCCDTQHTPAKVHRRFERPYFLHRYGKKTRTKPIGSKGPLLVTRSNLCWTLKLLFSKYWWTSAGLHCVSNQRIGFLITFHSTSTFRGQSTYWLIRKQTGRKTERNAFKLPDFKLVYITLKINL
jgi:hypothetical protein